MNAAVKELEDKVLMLRNAVDPRTRKPMREVSPRYAQELFAEQTRLAALKEDSRHRMPQINAQQLATMNRADLDLIRQASGAKNPATGKRYVDENPAARAKVFAATSQVMGGKPLSDEQKTVALKFVEGTK